ncbi:MAG: hypothetical protein ACP5HG_18510 [Anaerolineae bacterium]
MFEKSWRTIHWLNYVVFLLGTVHALLIGPNFQHPIVQVIATIMALTLVVVFVLKRLEERRRRRRRQKRA